MKTSQTTKCIRCGKPAVLWTGHVRTKAGEQITAGWCKGACKRIWAGYFGPYKASMGRGCS